MATLALWNGPPSEATRTQNSYEVGRIDFEHAVKDTDYTIDAVSRKHFTVLDDSDIYVIKMTFAESGLPYVELDKTKSPFPSAQYICQEYNGQLYYTSSRATPWAPLLDTEPANWDIHWRDQYNTMTFWNVQSIGCLQSGPLPTNVVGGTPINKPFTPDTYAASNISRKMFYTMGDNYFTITNGFDRIVEGGVPLMPVEYTGFGFVGRNAAQEDWGLAYVDLPRVSGLNGPYAYTETLPGARTFQSRQEVWVNPTELDGSIILPRTFCNFVGFTLTFDYEDTTVYPSTHETITDNFIGVFIWKETIDGIKLDGQMTAISLQYWTKRGSKGEWGPGTGVEGGDGLWTHRTTGPDDADGNKLKNEIETHWRTPRDTYLGGAGLHYYNPSAACLQDIAGALWSPSVWRDFQNLNFSPLDCILALHMIPSDFIHTNGTEYPKLATYTSSVAANVVDQTMVWKEMSIGSGSPIKELLNQTGSYQNFMGYCQATLHLPYIGNVSIDIQQCAEGSISVFYCCDVLSGDLTAFVYLVDRNGSGIYAGEYKGNCVSKIPLFMRTSDRLSTVAALGENARSFTNNLFDIGKSVLSAAQHATGSGGLLTKGQNLLGDAQDLTNTIGDQWENTADTVSNVIKLINPRYSVTGTNINMGSTSPSWTECWLELSFPEPSNPDQYQDLIGLPSDISGTINGSDSLDGPFTGFLAVREIKLDNITATDNEKKEIELLMKSGVYLDPEP